MCHYSVAEAHVRLPRDGEYLRIFQFPSGSKGFVPANPIARLHLCSGDSVVPSVVCLPERARVRVFDISAFLRHQLGVSPVEDATFIELPPNTRRNRDAIQFDNGQILALQDLPVGQHVEVLQFTEPHSTIRFWRPRRKKTGRVLTLVA